ncbi:glutathione S-transferase theta-3-like [Protopterus annectens]|uniref:glutathione S-transferase theta-3-like n=1 Tax=Protopterus annectens TaxID=7888 RepID=UPI001CF9869E|nr:glutathione S-transferase theta-3-like [Protopterus annectens]
MVVQLYLDLLSQPCRSVFIFAKINNIPFKLEFMNLCNGDQFTEEYAKVNLLRKVPALKDEDFTLAESVAILLYLSRKYNTPDHWYPSDLQKRARVDEYLSWQHTSVRPNAGVLLWMKVMIPKNFNISCPAEKIDTAVETLNDTLKEFESKFLQDKAFIAGEEISIADLVAYSELMQAFFVDINIFEGRPKLAAWRQRVESKIDQDILDEAHKSIRNANQRIIEPAVAEAYKTRLLKFIR